MKTVVITYFYVLQYIWTNNSYRFIFQTEKYTSMWTITLFNEGLLLLRNKPTEIQIKNNH